MENRPGAGGTSSPGVGGSQACTTPEGRGSLLREVAGGFTSWTTSWERINITLLDNNLDNGQERIAPNGGIRFSSPSLGDDGFIPKAGYTVGLPKKPRSGRPGCFRITLNAETAGVSKLILDAGTEHAARLWLAELSAALTCPKCRRADIAPGTDGRGRPWNYCGAECGRSADQLGWVRGVAPPQAVEDPSNSLTPPQQPELDEADTDVEVTTNPLRRHDPAPMTAPPPPVETLPAVETPQRTRTEAAEAALRAGMEAAQLVRQQEAEQLGRNDSTATEGSGVNSLTDGATSLHGISRTSTGSLRTSVGDLVEIVRNVATTVVHSIAAYEMPVRRSPDGSTATPSTLDLPRKLLLPWQK